MRVCYFSRLKFDSKVGWCSALALKSLFKTFPAAVAIVIFNRCFMYDVFYNENIIHEVKFR